MLRELYGESFDEADHAAFARAIMRVKRLPALPRRRRNRNNLARLLLDHLRHAEMNDRVHALQIHPNHVIPLLLAHFLDRQVLDIPDSRVGHHNIQSPEPSDALVHQLLVVGWLPDIRLKRFDPRSVLFGFLLDLKRGVLGFVVAKDYVRAGLRKEFDGRRADSRENHQ